MGIAHRYIFTSGSFRTNSGYVDPTTPAAANNSVRWPMDDTSVGATSVSPDGYALTLSLPFNDNGVDNLDTSLTLNSVTKTPTLRYTADDCGLNTWTAWTYGNSLSANGALPSPSFNQGSPLFGSANDDSVNFAGSVRYYTASGTTFGNVSTDDFVVEVLFKVGSNKVMFAKRTGGGVGYEVGIDANDKLYLTIEDAGGNVDVLSAALVSDTWYYGICFADRSGSGQWYVNGVASGAAVDISGANLTLNSATSFAAGADSGGNNPYDSNIAYFALWQGAAWLDTHLQASTAKERFVRLVGLYPDTAGGTAVPSVVTRDSVAHLDKLESGVRYLYQVGAHWIRLVDRNDSNPTNIKGLLPEVETTNICGSSQVLDSADWTTTNLTVTDNDVTAPNKEVVGSTFTESVDGGDVEHQDAQTLTFVANKHYAASAWVVAGTKDWVRLKVDLGGGPSPECYFDVATPATGTGANINDSGYEDWGDGWIRVWMTWQQDAMYGGAYDFIITTCLDDLDPDYTGVGGDALSVACVQIEPDVSYPTSYMITGLAGTATREGDQLRYVGDDGNLGGVGSGQQYRIEGAILLEDYTNFLAGHVVTITDGGALADSMIVYVLGTTDTISVITAATAGQAGSATSATEVVDGAIHSFSTYMVHNDLRLYLDEAHEGLKDASVDLPDDLDRIDVGKYNTDAYQLNGVISSLKIYDTPVPPVTLAQNAAPSYEQWTPLMLSTSGFKKGIELNGSTDFFVADDGSVYDVLTEDFSISAWFRSNDISSTQQIANKRAAGAGYSVYLDSSKLYMSVHDGAEVADDVSVVLLSGIWYFVTVNFDRSGNAYAYVNGASEGINVDISGSNGSLTTSNYFRIGDDTGGVSRFNGCIATVTFSNGLTTLTEHQTMYHSAFSSPV